MVSTVSYSVEVDLEELEFCMSSAAVDKICRALHVDSLKQAHVQANSICNGITFFTLVENA